MSAEAEIIAKSPRPSTASTLSADIRGLGLTDGDVVIVHSSLSKLGWVAGAVVECFRHLPDTIRSPHPHLSLAAHGPQAHSIVDEQPLARGTGQASPLGRLYELDALILLLGVPTPTTPLSISPKNTPPGPASPGHSTAPLLVGGERQWVTWDDLDLDDSDFADIGEAFAARGGERTGPVGAGTGRLLRQREIVDFAVDWMTSHRPDSLT
jgi:aminoglycoside 3-N-acetyltransferase